MLDNDKGADNVFYQPQKAIEYKCATQQAMLPILQRTKK